MVAFRHLIINEEERIFLSGQAQIDGEDGFCVHQVLFLERSQGCCIRKLGALVHESLSFIVFFGLSFKVLATRLVKSEFPKQGHREGSMLALITSA